MDISEQEHSKFHSNLHSKYPAVLQKNNETESLELYRAIESLILTSQGDLLEKLMWEIPIKLEVLRKNYGMTQAEREFIACVYLHYIFDKPTSVFEKQTLLSTLNALIGRNKLDNIKLSWRKIYHFFDEVLFSSKVDFNLGRSGFDMLFMAFLEFLKKARWLYEESHIDELFLTIRQTITLEDSSKVKAFALLYCFFKGHRDYSSKYYEKYLPEIIEFWSWRANDAYNKIFFEVLSRLAKDNTEIDWKPYYELIFQNFLKLLIADFPLKETNFVSNPIDIPMKVGLLFEKDGHGHGHRSRKHQKGVNMHSLLVYCVKPGDEEFWTNMERVVNICQIYCHPDNQGKWTQAIAGFFLRFAKEYIKRYFKEKRWSENPSSDAKKHCLDEDCHKRFLALNKKLLTFLMFTGREQIHLVAQLARNLIYFKPDEIVPFIMETVNYSLTLPEFSMTGMAQLLAYIAHPLLSRRNYNKGLYELPELLFKTLDHITPSDRKKTKNILLFYSKVAELVPLYDPEDLEAELKKLKLEPELEIFNEKEEINFPRFIDQISNWALDFFTKFIQMLPFFDEKISKEKPPVRALLIDHKNKFTAFISASSHRLRKRYLEIFVGYLTENTEKTPNMYVSDIIQAFNLADPAMTLKYLFPVVKEKLLMKRHDSSFKTDNALQEYLLGHAKHHEHVRSFELKTINKEILIWYLSILKDLVSYSQGLVRDYEADLEAIFILTLGHKELEVCELTAQVIQTLILSILSIYPTNLSCLNRSQTHKGESIRYIYRDIGRLPKENLEADWYQSNSADNEYAVYLTKLFKDSIISGFTHAYLSEVSEVWPEDLTTLVDVMNLNRQESSPQKKQELTRGTLLVYTVFKAIAQRASFKDVYLLSNSAKGFEADFFLRELDDARMKAVFFAHKLTYWCIRNGYSQDEKIMSNLSKIISIGAGEDEHNNQLVEHNKFLKRIPKSFNIPFTRAKYESRFLFLCKLTLSLQRKIYSYHFGLKRTKKSALWSEPFVLLAFNTNEQVGRTAAYILNAITLSSKEERDLIPLILQKVIDLCQSKLAAISLQNNELEEGKEIVLNQTFDLKLTKANRATYLESLSRGLSRICGIAAATNYFSDNLSSVLAKLAIVQQFGSVLKDQKAASKMFEMIFKILRSVDLSRYDPLVMEPSLRGGKVLTKAPEKFQQFIGKDIEELFSIHLAMDEFFKKTLSLSAIVVANKSIHWKNRMLSVFLALMFARLTDPDSQEFNAFYKACASIINEEHYYLRLIGLGAVSLLLRVKSRVHNLNSAVSLEQKDFENKQIPIEQFLENHFNRPEDLQIAKNIKTFTGYLDIYTSFKKAPVVNYDKISEDPFARWLLEGNNFKTMLSTMTSDISAKNDDSTHNADKSKGFMPEITPELLLNMVFVKTTKVSLIQISGSNQNSFSLMTARFFKKLFAAFGPMILSKSIEEIEGYVQDIDSKEKQGITMHYLAGLVRASRFWDQKSRKEAQHKAATILRKAIEQVSAEFFISWTQAIKYITKETEATRLRDFFDCLFINPFELKATSNIQGRYLTIYSSFFNAHAYQLRDYALKLLEFFRGVTPKDMRQATEIALTINIIIHKVYFVPINKQRLVQLKYVKDAEKLEELEIKGAKIVKSGQLHYEFNHQVAKLIEDLVERAKSKEEDKPMFYLVMTLVLSLQGSRVHKVQFDYYRPAIKFMIEFNPEENSNLDQESIATFKKYAEVISKSFYSSENLDEILKSSAKAFESQSYRQRERTTVNLHFTRFNNTFSLKSVADIYPIDQALVDENNHVRNAAFDGLKDLMKVFTKSEIDQIIEGAKKTINTKGVEEKTKAKALITLMSLVLSCPFEIEEWMEEPLRIIVKNKSAPNPVKDRVKDFFGKFWKTQKGSKHLNRRELPSDLYDSIRDISNPYSYFS